MGSSPNRRFVFTGGPGAGKTTVLDELQARGYYCVPDTARSIIKARLASGLSPRPEPTEFAQNVFDIEAANYRSSPSDEVSLFDRGIVDVLGSLKQSGIFSADEIERLLRQYRYNEMVFHFPPWQEIYRTDAERDHTFEHSVRVFESGKSWYARCGYQAVVVPRGSVEERVELIERMIAEASSG